MIAFLVFGGFAALSAGTYRQSRRLLGAAPMPAMRLSCLALGYALLAVSLALVLTAPDAARRLIEWFGLLTVAALAVVLGWWASEG